LNFMPRPSRCVSSSRWFVYYHGHAVLIHSLGARVLIRWRIRPDLPAQGIRAGGSIKASVHPYVALYIWLSLEVSGSLQSSSLRPIQIPPLAVAESELLDTME
jgi:hypothetical protein